MFIKLLSRFNLDETAKPVPRKQILRHELKQRKISFRPVQLTTGRVDNHTLLQVLAIAMPVGQISRPVV